ncbi:NAD-dependent succinate-semialdehyde dehydrogenase [Vibrio sp.]|uniref:NAD-dependent succinate-semialdehyde dehydrogenase n=1 Tax=Vibrio sp. TaxID=678 RepID=UPI003D0C039F
MQALNDPQLLPMAIATNDQQQQLVVTNPADDSVLCALKEESDQEIEQRIEAAHKAQPAWAAKSAKERSVIIRKWFDLLIAATDDLAKIMTLEQGKPLAEAKGEVAYGASFVEWFGEEAKRAYGDTIPAPVANRQLQTIKQPVGVAAAITPWNFPIAMITRKAAPALAAGCAFISKPAANTPLSALAVAELAYRAGVPRELFPTIVSSRAAAVGQIFCHNPLIRKLSFTGSTRVGKILMQQSASQVQRVSMELGGNAPFVVFADADIDLAVAGAIASKFRNAGQTCVCANRFYVASEVYDEFSAKFSAAVEALRVGNGLDEGVQIGPMIDQAAVEKVASLVDEACSNGATIAVGGRRLEQGANFYAPTVLTNVSHDNPIMREEIFGPVAPLCRFDNIEQVIEWCNDTEYGLASYFYSQNINQIWKVATQLEYGMVGINEGIISTEVAPFGGIKQSGVGREGSHQGMEEYQEVKYLCFGGLNA